MCKPPRRGWASSLEEARGGRPVRGAIRRFRKSREAAPPARSRRAALPAKQSAESSRGGPERQPSAVSAVAEAAVSRHRRRGERVVVAGVPALGGECMRGVVGASYPPFLEL